RRRHTRSDRDWSSDVCSSDLVKYDEWAETTSERHKKVVQGILQRLFDAGQIYKDKQAGYYSVRQEQFLTDKERGADGQFGPEWRSEERRVGKECRSGRST